MISFDKGIYLKDAVIQGCHDYENIATICYKETSEQIFCEIMCSHNELEQIENEFGNYVLDLSVMMGGTNN